MFKKISLLLLLSLVYINPVFGAGWERDWCAPLYGERLEVRGGRPGNNDDMLRVVRTYCRDSAVTQQYMDGHPRDPQNIRRFFQGSWSEAWAKKSPFGMRYVSAKEDFPLTGHDATTAEGRSKFVLQGEHLGMVGFTVDSDCPNTVQIFYLFEPFAWNNHVATETLEILLGQHLRGLLEAGVTLPSGAPLEKLSATALKDGNVFSNKILRGLFGEPVHTAMAYGSERNVYNTPVAIVLGNLDARLAERAARATGVEASA